MIRSLKLSSRNMIPLQFKNHEMILVIGEVMTMILKILAKNEEMKLKEDLLEDEIEIMVKEKTEEILDIKKGEEIFEIEGIEISEEIVMMTDQMVM